MKWNVGWNKCGDVIGFVRWLAPGIPWDPGANHCCCYVFGRRLPAHADPANFRGKSRKESEILDTEIKVGSKWDQMRFCK